MKTIKIELTKNEVSEMLMVQLANEVKLGLISKAQAMALFLEHLKQEYGYIPTVNEYQYKKAI